MEHFNRDEFKSFSQKDKKDFIEKLLDYKLRLHPEELEAATKDQKKRYFDSLIERLYDLESFEIEAATNKQLEEYIDQKVWISLSDYEKLSQNLKKHYIDVCIRKKTGLSNEEFWITPAKLQKYYGKKMLKKGRHITPIVFSKMPATDQKKYVDFVLKNEEKLTADYEIHMKSGVKKYYDKQVQENPYLWENKLRQKIRQAFFLTENFDKKDPFVYNNPKLVKTIEEAIYPSSFHCTSVASAIKMLEGDNVKIYGFSTRHNPSAKYFVEENGLNSDEGHHFAVMNGRYIIDPWIYDNFYEGGAFNRSVFDLKKQNDQEIIKYIYGNKERWVDITNEVYDFKKAFPKTYQDLIDFYSQL